MFSNQIHLIHALTYSNTGGGSIAQETYSQQIKGKDRKDIDFKSLENAINLSAFNEKGGLWKSWVIEKQLIDFYVPFLPLERFHVKQCILDYLKERHNITRTLDDKFTVEVRRSIQVSQFL